VPVFKFSPDECCYTQRRELPGGFSVGGNVLGVSLGVVSYFQCTGSPLGPINQSINDVYSAKIIIESKVLNCYSRLSVIMLCVCVSNVQFFFL